MQIYLSDPGIKTEVQMLRADMATQLTVEDYR
jgi:hypothetical protein